MKFELKFKLEVELLSNALVTDVKMPYLFKFFKGCLPQILLGPLLNVLSQIC